ncbi:MAG: CCC motif membrane protein [Bacteroidia bacterium]
MENTSNPQTPNQSEQGGFVPAKNLPNAVAVLVLGICSIFPGCFCAGLVGIVCGIIALVLAKKDLALYNANPSSYNPGSFNNLKAGRVCAIIGLSLSSLLLIFYIIYFAILGAAFSMVPWAALGQ